MLCYIEYRGYYFFAFVFYFAAYLRIEIHFLHWEMKGHWSRVNLVKCKALFRDLHATSVLSFPNANEKLYFNPYIYAKAIKLLKVEKKSVSIFSSRDQCLLLEKYLPQLSYALLQANAMEV